MAAKSTKRKTSTKGKSKKKQENTVLHGEIIILGVLAVCIFLLISNFGLGGLIGDIFSALMFGLFGWMAYPLPLLIFGVTAFLISNRGNTHAYIKAAAVVMFSILLTAFLELLINSYEPGTTVLEYYRQASIGKEAGGVLGGCLISLLCPAIGVVGTYVILILLMLISIILITEKSLLKPLRHSGKKVYEGAKKRRQTAAIHAAKRRDASEKNEKKKGKAGKTVSGVSFATTLVPEKGNSKSPEVQELTPDGFDPDVFPPETAAQTEDVFSQPDALPPIFEETQKSEFLREESQDEVLLNQGGMQRREAEANDIQKNETRSEKVTLVEETKGQEYKIPPLNLLKRGKAGGGDSDRHLRETAAKLEQTLQNFGVRVRVTNASCGPSVTRYELQPEQGVKVSKIVGLADDIKLNLAVTDLRIEAPIPGKAAVGIEVPNSENSAVMLRDLLESKEFQNSASKITFAVGKDIAGKVVIADIAKMPHLLVAGSTGSGKSVCINTLIMSIIYKSDPEDVKLIMVDPKVVELSVYNGIPHLLIPVVTDPRKAAGALNWAVTEMMKRYQLFAEYNVRDLKGFNEKTAQMGDVENIPKKMPQIVIIVDELADLMMVAPKDVEGAICRLAQLARAAGIHLILATQRPSVNVITGLIKANMPSRIAFAVSSGVDSRTIIDMNGAEKLLGKGDMLFYPTGYPKPVRVQGSFVSDKEVQKVVEYLIQKNGNASYSDELDEHMNADLDADGMAPGGMGSTDNSDNRDTYFADAGRLIIEKEKASIGMLQRMFKIGFNRAARIMDQLAEAGVVGPEEGTKPRKVLMQKEEFEQYLQENK